jgi:hypothetical protein
LPDKVELTPRQQKGNFDVVCEPKVYCVMQLQNQGAGFPDGGLFTRDQLQNVSESEPLLGQLPARGEVRTLAEVRRELER